MIAEAEARPGSGPGSNGTGPPAPGVLDELSGALASARSGVAGLLELATLEARRAGLSLVWMAACGFAAAICLVASWFGLLAAVAIWATSLGLAMITAVIAVAALNAVAGIVLLQLCISRSADLRFPATQRQLAGPPPGIRQPAR